MILFLCFQTDFRSAVVFFKVGKSHSSTMYLSFAIGAYGISIGVKNGFLNILSVTCKVIFSEYTSSVMPGSLHLQNIRLG
jgi:hypothetical protein